MSAALTAVLTAVLLTQPAVSSACPTQWTAVDRPPPPPPSLWAAAPRQGWWAAPPALLYPRAEQGVRMYPQVEEETRMYPRTEQEVRMYPRAGQGVRMYPQVEEETRMYPRTEQEVRMYPQAEQGVRMYPQVEEETGIYPGVEQGVRMYPQAEQEAGMYPHEQQEVRIYPRPGKNVRWLPTEAEQRYHPVKLEDVAAVTPILLARRVGPLGTPPLWNQVDEVRLSRAYAPVSSRDSPLGRHSPPDYSTVIADERRTRLLPQPSRQVGVMVQYPATHGLEGRHWRPPLAAPSAGGSFPPPTLDVTGYNRRPETPLSPRGLPVHREVIRQPPAGHSPRSGVLAVLQQHQRVPPRSVLTPPLGPAAHITARRLPVLPRHPQQPMERFSSLPAHFQDPADGYPRPPLAPPLLAPSALVLRRYYEPLPVSPPPVPSSQSTGLHLYPQQFHGPAAAAVVQPSQLPPQAFSGRTAARPTSPTGAAAVVAAPLYRRTEQLGSGLIRPVQFTAERRRAELPSNSQFYQQTFTDNGAMWKQYRELAGRSSIPTNPATAAEVASKPLSGVNATSSSHPVQPSSSTSLPTLPPKLPPSPIEHSDIPKVTAGVVMTATEGLTLPLTAAAAILDKFGTAVAVPFPGMGAAIARAAGVLGGAAESANKMAPTMAPLLADTLEEVWKQAAKAETQAATSVNRWVDFSNGVNVFEVTAEGDGNRDPVSTEPKNKTGDREEATESWADEEDILRAVEGDEAAGEDEAAGDTSRGETDTAAVMETEGGQNGEDRTGGTVDRTPSDILPAESLNLKERLENINWTQFLLSRRQLQADQGIAARSFP